jgi:hypothetical protein
MDDIEQKEERRHYDKEILDSIIELKVNIGEIKTDIRNIYGKIEEIKETINKQDNKIETKCDDCYTTKKLEEHIDNHKNNLTNKIAIVAICLSTVLSVGSMFFAIRESNNKQIENRIEQNDIRNIK